MPKIPRCRATVLALTLAVVCSVQPAAGAESLAARLRALADDHGFRLQGIEKVGGEPAVAAEGDLAAELRLLLAGYNYVVDGVPPSVQRVIILGAKEPLARGFRAETTRDRGHHLVHATLQGAAGHRATIELIVDTGATTVVLPDSMIAALGFNGGDLARQRGQTVNGIVTGRAARLASVEVGSAIVRDVAVLFVADDRLGGASLLGMSFLDRFSISIDDAADKAGSTLVLTPR